MIIPQDYHMHSDFSPDCRFPMREMCLGAIENGVQEIGFTEHYDLHPGDSYRDWFKPESWWVELDRCREEFAGRVTIRAGIELGEPHIFVEEAVSMLAAYPFDYALGSLHWVDNKSMFSVRHFQTTPQDEAFERYFAELARLTASGDFDILSHFDVLVRNAYRVYGGYEPLRYEAAMRPALQNCIDRGIALDINTSSLRKGLPLSTPGLDILRLYASMGGERVTLGSDAHRPQHVGVGLDVAMQIAKEAGIHYITHFSQREATLVPI